jgi:hypothetical protein
MVFVACISGVACKACLMCQAISAMSSHIWNSTVDTQAGTSVTLPDIMTKAAHLIQCNRVAFASGVLSVHFTTRK